MMLSRRSVINMINNSKNVQQFERGTDCAGTDPAPDRSKEVGIPDALKNFDSLPDSASVRLPVVKALKACSAATVWRMVKRGDLPAPRKISERITAWNVGELRKALAA
ncbi:helix-turn-helix transcriptional regulator [Candidatus Accumulibacter phosphatis]